MNVNDHFYDYIFNWDKRFYMVVGSYGSSKSYNTALKLILKAVQEPNRKILVTRQVYRTLKESCYDLLKEIIYTLGLEKVCSFKTSPLSIEFNNGSRFIFVGLDDTAKLKSIHGVSIIWIEETVECSYAAFKELNGRLRTLDQSMHIVMSTNPVSTESWVYKHFFLDKQIADETLYDERILEVDDTYYHHSTVDDNVYVPESYVKQLDELKIHDPDLYRIARLGKFGQLGVKVYYNIYKEEHDKVMEQVNKTNLKDRLDGIDFGFSISYNAFVRCAIDRVENILYVYESFYNKDLINSELVELLKPLKNSYHNLTGDSSRPELIEEIRRSGIKIFKTKKGKGSVAEGIQKIKSFSKVVVSDRCEKVYQMMRDWTRAEDKNGVVQEDKFSFDNHFSDAIVYAIEEYRAIKYKHGRIDRGGI